MESYPTNPNQLPEGKPTPKGSGQEIKKSVFSKFFESMIVEDYYSIRRHVIGRVILPGIAKLINDILMSTINAAFNGIGSPSSTPSNNGPVDYNAVSSPVRVIGNSNMTQPYKDPNITKRYSFKQLGYVHEHEAREVLAQLQDDIKHYKMATLLHYYEYSDVETNSTENNWGWKDLSTAEIYFDYGTNLWVIKLPKVQPLD